MHKLSITASAGILVLIAALASQASPPEHITIDDCVNKHPPVEFPHAQHVEQLECSSCHHTQETLSTDTADQAEPCSECHNEPENDDTPSCSQMSLKKNQYHINCVGCHKEQGEGPTKCNECHPKD